MINFNFEMVEIGTDCAEFDPVSSTEELRESMATDSSTTF